MDVLKRLGITNKGSFARNGSYVIDIEDSDEFGRIYSILDRNPDLEYMENNSLLTIDNGSLYYLYDRKYQINLIADFKNDNYKLVATEV